MKKYLIHCDVKDASGWQEWIVEAKDKEDALKKWDEGDYSFDDYDQEVEVTSLFEPEVHEIDD